jgi:hypothetical protein
MVQVTFVVTDYEIFSTVIRTVRLLLHAEKFQFLTKIKATSAGNLFISLSRNGAVAELCSGKFNEAYCCDPE